MKVRETYRRSNSSPSVYTFFVAEAERNEFMTSLELQRGIRHVINRATLYDNVLSLYNTKLDKVINEYPFRVQFEGEMAVDVGGVTRDLFSEFFAEMYLHLFDGMCLLYPAMHSSVNMATFKTVGAVISHAYLVSGVFPDRVAFPCLAAALLGPNIVISDALLRDSFISSLSVHEASIVRNAMCQSGSNYSISMQAELVSILSCYGCKEAPRPANLSQLLIQASRYSFSVKPAAAISMMNTGVPKKHQSFWKIMTVEKLHSLYLSLSVSNAKVLSLLKEPVIQNVSQEDVWQFLRKYVGSMAVDELRTFLRFVTGSFVISVPSISVTFNSLDGLARRPIAHTCSAMLEISSMYVSLQEFMSEFRSILSDPYYSWRMDSV